MKYCNGFDIERLRKDLIDYYGSATSVFPVTLIDLINVENATDEELIRIVLRNNIDLNNYENDVYRKIK